MRAVGRFLFCVSVGFGLGLITAHQLAPSFGNNSPSIGLSMMLVELLGAGMGAVVGLFVVSITQARTEQSTAKRANRPDSPSTGATPFGRVGAPR